MVLQRLREAESAIGAEPLGRDQVMLRLGIVSRWDGLRRRAGDLEHHTPLLSDPWDAAMPPADPDRAGKVLTQE